MSGVGASILLYLIGSLILSYGLHHAYLLIKSKKSFFDTFISRNGLGFSAVLVMVGIGFMVNSGNSYLLMNVSGGSYLWSTLIISLMIFFRVEIFHPFYIRFFGEHEVGNYYGLAIGLSVFLFFSFLSELIKQGSLG